jgi:hypothetical protein
MDLKDYKCLKRNSKHRKQLSTHHFNNSVDVLVHVFLEIVEVSFAKSFFDTERPVDLIYSEHDLTRPFADPLLHVGFLVVDVGFLGKLANRSNHDEFNFFHPLLDISLLAAFVDIYFPNKRNFFLLGRNHVTDFFSFGESDT